jgi:putrescine transport system substrate-binding protein
MNRILRLTALCLLLAACQPEQPPAATGDAPPAPAATEGSRVLHIYNWSDYIAEDTIENFERETGIDVTYDVYDSNEALEAKLMVGGTGYDIVVPSSSFMARQIRAGVYQPIDRARVPNYGNLDPLLMQQLETVDPGNAHGVPYLMGTTGIGYNVDKVREVLGANAPIGSWDLVFKPENAQRLAECGIMVLDAPAEIVPTALRYLGEDPNSFDPAVIERGFELLRSIRPYIRNFHSSEFINAMAGGDICVVIGWSGDILQARDRANEAGNGVRIDYFIPREGAVLFFDVLGIPKDAPNAANAHLFIDYLLRPEVMAGISNYVSYANAVAPSLPLIDESVRNNPGVYPPAELQAKLFTLAVVPPEVDRLYTRGWTALKTGQ